METKAWFEDRDEVLLQLDEKELRIYAGAAGPRKKKRLTVIPAAAADGSLTEVYETEIQRLREQGYTVEGDSPASSKKEAIAYYTMDGNATDVSFDDFPLNWQIVKTNRGTVARIEGYSDEIDVPVDINGRKSETTGYVIDERDLAILLIIQHSLEKGGAPTRVSITSNDLDSITPSTAAKRYPAIRPWLEKHGVVLGSVTPEDLDAPELFI